MRAAGLIPPINSPPTQFGEAANIRGMAAPKYPLLPATRKGRQALLELSSA
jgi:hypothetical protein